jgi:hypothetical protein
MRPPPLDVSDILRWADAFHQKRDRWPHRDDGAVEGTIDLTWRKIDSALKLGNRGLQRGSSLAKLFLARRKRRHKGMPPTLTETQILTWADAHNARTGDWPIYSCGGIPGVKGETWSAVDHSLRIGRRGLPGGSSLAQLLEARRGVRNVQAVPDLTVRQVLIWADAYRAKNGSWPTRESGPIDGVPGETWSAVAQAFVVGGRGLGARSSLAQFLSRHRDVRNHLDATALTAETILAWADAHHVRTGEWPKRGSGAIPDAEGEKWSAVDAALVMGVRSLPGESSLAKLLAEHRGVRNKQALPRLTTEQIREWIEAYHERTGEWSKPGSGLIPESPGETWAAVNTALARGGRGLPGGLSLYGVVCECRKEDAQIQELIKQSV